jgi:hypothetical protein
MLLLYLFVLLCVIYNIAPVVEKYITVGYNNFTVPDVKITNLYETDVDQLKKKVDSINTDLILNKKVAENYNGEYIKYNNVISFPINDYIKEVVQEFIKSKFEDKIVINGDLFNINYLVNNSDMSVIFDIRIVNLKKFFSITLRVKMIILDCDDLIRYILNQSNIKPRSSYTYRLITMNVVDIEKDDLQVTGVDQLKPDTYYKIMNNLNLTSPFYTSSNTENNNPF